MMRVALLILALLSVAANAQAAMDAGSASVTPRLGTAVPTQLEFTDERGAAVRLGNYLGRAPIFLVPVYYRCPNLCGATMEGLFAALNDLTLAPGSDYQVVAFSIDPRETPAVAQEERVKYATEFPRIVGAGVHLLTASAASSSALADALGFRYSFDAASGQYAHDVEIVVLTPAGTIAAYASTLAPTSATLQSALDAARKGIVARSVDRLVLFCFHLLPANGRNTPLIEHILQGIAAATVLAIGGLLWTLHRRGTGSRA